MTDPKPLRVQVGLPPIKRPKREIGMDGPADNQLLGLRLASIRELEDAEDHWDHKAFVLRDVVANLDDRIKIASTTRDEYCGARVRVWEEWHKRSIHWEETRRKHPDDDPDNLRTIRAAKQADAVRCAELARIAGACWRARADRVKADFTDQGPADL